MINKKKHASRIQTQEVRSKDDLLNLKSRVIKIKQNKNNQIFSNKTDQRNGKRAYWNRLGALVACRIQAARQLDWCREDKETREYPFFNSMYASLDMSSFEVHTWQVRHRRTYFGGWEDVVQSFCNWDSSVLMYLIASQLSWQVNKYLKIYSLIQHKTNTLNFNTNQSRPWYKWLYRSCYFVLCF